MNILRDLSLLQIQMRELPGFLVRRLRPCFCLWHPRRTRARSPAQETRRKMLELKANQRNNWMGFALAHHLRGQYDQAAHVLQTYEGTETPVRAPPSPPRRAGALRPSPAE